MPQTSYLTLMPIGVAGELYDSGYTNVLSPLASVEVIAAGLGVAKVVGADMQVRLPINNLATIVFGGVLVTANVINGNVCGAAIAPVTFATDSPTTMLAIAAAIAAVPGVVSATVNNLTITVVTNNSVAANVNAWVVTLGAGQASVTLSNLTSDTLYGVALLDESQMNNWSSTGSTGMLPYQIGQCVSDLTKGRVYVVPETTVTSDSAVYLRFITGGSPGQVRGNFRGDSDSGKALLVPTNIARWILGAVAGSPAVLEVELP